MPITPLAVIVNERVTTAIKHGGGEVSVLLEENKGNMCINVVIVRDHLPDEISCDDTKSFGLRAVRSMLSGMGRRISAPNLMEAGTLFLVNSQAPFY